MKKAFFLLVLLFWAAPMTVKAGSESAPESVPTASLGPISDLPEGLGSVTFMLDSNDADRQPGSVHVGEKDRVYFCVKIDPNNPRVRHAIKYLRAIEVTLEGEGENPQKITGRTALKKRVIRPNGAGCYWGKLRIPENTPPGKYRLSELDLWESPLRSLSLREELPNVSPKGVIEVESPHLDRNSPVVEKIEVKSPQEDPVKFNGHRGWALAQFRLVASDLISGIKPETLKIFFKIFLDGTLVDIQEANCKPRLPNLFFDCKLYFSRAEPDMRGRTVQLVLDSISLSDRLGNDTEISEVEALKKLTGGELLRYVYYTRRPHGAQEPKGDDEMVKWPVQLVPQQEQEKDDKL
ncbi:MAG: hypothetical protein U1F57_10410 [bacterium]